MHVRAASAGTTAAAAATLFGLVYSTDAASAAESSCGRQRPYVLVDFSSLVETLEGSELHRHLSVELASRGLDTCGKPAPSKALAELRVEPEQAGQNLFRLTLRDTVTGKTTLRVLDLTSIPRNGRALALSISSSELLLASWAELGLRRAPPAGHEVPAVVQQTLVEHDATFGERKESRYWLGVALAGQAFSRHESAAGADLGLARKLVPPFGVRGRLGFRQAAPLTAENGEVNIWSVRGELALSLELLPLKSWGLGAVAGLDAARYAVSGDPDPDAIAHSSQVFGASAFAGVELRLALSPAWRAMLELQGGHTLRGVHAFDGNVRAAALAGPYLGLALGLEMGL